MRKSTADFLAALSAASFREIQEYEGIRTRVTLRQGRLEGVLWMRWEIVWVGFWKQRIAERESERTPTLLV